MKKYLLGIDIGTTSAKLGLYGLNGEEVGSWGRGYKTHCPEEGAAEHDTNDWWMCVVDGMHDILEKSEICPSEIGAIGLTSLTTILLPLDGSGKPLSRAFIWADSRCGAYLNELREIAGDAAARNTGNNFTTNSLATKLYWLKRFDLKLYEESRCFLAANGYIGFRLTGQYSMDKSNLELMMMGDIKKRDWSHEMCDLLGIDIAKLPPVRGCSDIIGHVTKEAANETGLAEGTPVIAGLMDSTASCYAMGVTEEGMVCLDVGNAANLCLCTTKLAAKPAGFLCESAIPGTWVVQDYCATSGAGFRWVKDSICLHEAEEAKKEGIEDFTYLDRMAMKVPTGSGGLVFVPYLVGSSSFAQAKGAFVGVTLNTGKPEFIKSVLEGAAFEIRLIKEKFEQLFGIDVSSVTMVGGGSKSPHWTQIHSDILQLPIQVPDISGTAALGTALLAGKAANILPPDFNPRNLLKIKDAYEPIPENVKRYNEQYRYYLKAAEAQIVQAEG